MLGGMSAMGAVQLKVDYLPADASFTRHTKLLHFCRSAQQTKRALPIGCKEKISAPDSSNTSHTFAW